MGLRGLEPPLSKLKVWCITSYATNPKNIIIIICFLRKGNIQNPHYFLTGAVGIEPTTFGFGDQIA